MDVLIGGSLLSLMICVGALATEWRLLARPASKAPSDMPNTAERRRRSPALARDS
jgi:hypothetical protein